ncbi:uncharacterized protein LOC128238506 [Mya arenaria]|uniref:uncharacterized protein LOC128238506 n=1 Tax=Mya arenaria TaxID=6604 RepID=UPI0022E1925A|nr:uncharacterized protein LOC128238506 [Mya arenaria]XP_052810453.1 uncharacterized protein LOC128238506 [Mya arenaria]XP_052810454.1 uncharacterized protein LOC128238506 [Mya arenaria]
MHDGEDIIVYTAKGKTSARKILLTTPSNESDMASILFHVGDTLKHRVNIVGVPCQKESSSPGEALLSISGGATSGDQKETMAVNSGRAKDSDAGNLPKPAFPSSGMTSVPVGPGPRFLEGSSYETGESAYKKLLSNTSLKVLANAIAPNDVYTLLIQLEVPPVKIDQERLNNPGDIGSAYFKCLYHWRSIAGLKGAYNLEVDKYLFNKLIEVLTELGRNDIKRVLMKVLG